jgi:hypothetical protein
MATKTASLLMLTPLLALLAACDGEAPEYTVLCEGCCDCDDDTGDTGEVGSPIAKVSHDVVEIGLYCEAIEAMFSISNSGDGPLTLSAPTVTGDWTIATPPTEVPAGGTVDIYVTPGSTGGAGLVEFTTNDPNMATITVSLQGDADQAPTLTLGSIPPVVAPGASALLEAMAQDDESPTFLDVEWSSDVDGVLGTDGADSSGLIEHTWDGTLRSSGDHTVTLTTTDTCGNSAQEQFEICQNEGYTEDNIDLAAWDFSGSANWDATNSWVELTTASSYKKGSAFMTAETVDSDNVSIAFKFYAGDRQGADGLSLTAIDTSRMTTYVGSTGGGIGYGSLPGWSIEIDTWDNTGDPGYTEPTTKEHVALVIDGASKGNGVAFAEIHDVEDGAWHDMEVEVIGQQVTVTIDGIVYINQVVPEITNFPAHVGFTAATGSQTNRHLIDALTVENFVCDEVSEG